MMYLLGALAYLLIGYETFVHFCAIMRLREVRDAGQLTRTSNFLGKVTLAVGFFWDFLFNLLWGTVLFFPDMPRELLFTSRLERLMVHGWPWQRRLAVWTCAELGKLDSTGCHCKEK